MTDRQLRVMLYGRQIGVVEQAAYGRHIFRYETDYAGARDATPLSLSMPLADTSYPKAQIEPYLEGLMPDSEEVRAVWGMRFGVNGRNPFALLEQMGMDCAGAVQFARPGAEVDLLPESVLEPIAGDEIGRRLAALRSDDSSWSVPGERWSLAGAQSKFALHRDAAGGWFRAIGSAPTTHIVKPGVVGYREQALNEHSCLTAATLLGLPAAKSEFTEFGGEPALVVTRYDRRRASDGSVIRVHQEDLCQAMAVYPHRKYEASGGPTASRIATFLRQSVSDPEMDVRRFVTAVIFNYLIGAPDAHAKNYSILLAGDQVRLAPLYDIASGLPYDATGDSELHLSAMGIGGRKEFGTVKGRHWDRFAAQCAVETEFVRDEVTRLATGLPDALDRAFADHRASALRSRLLQRVGDLATTTLQDLAT